MIVDILHSGNEKRNETDSLLRWLMTERSNLVQYPMIVVTTSLIRLIDIPVKVKMSCNAMNEIDSPELV